MKIKLKNILGVLLAIFSFSISFTQKNNPNRYNIFYYENDSVSAEGFLQEGKPNGYWKNYERTGKLKSEGNRKDFLLDSIWKFYKNGFIKEQVNYQENGKNGSFIEFADSGVLYSKSTFVNDTLQGKRTIYYSTGELKFLYNYLEGNYHGEAFEYAKDSTVISIFEYNKGKLVIREKINRYNAQNKKTGLWKEFSTSGIVREEGIYKNGKRDGIFKEYKYNGELKELKKYDMDELQVDAEELKFVELYKIYYPTGELHFTVAKDDYNRRQGATQEFDKQGNIIQTEIFKNDTLFAKGFIDGEGLKQGKWKYFYKGEKIIGEGKYNNDLKTGTWNYLYSSLKKEQQGKFSKGERTGKWVWHYESGAIRSEEFYLRGKENGEFTEYDEEGNILTKGEYVNGLREGDWFYQVGDHIEKGKYIEGEKEGDWTYYYDNEQLYFKGSYKNGKEIKKHIYYHKNGNKKWVGDYKLGKKTGKWSRYDEFGTELINYTFRNGVLIKTDGVKIKPAFNKEIEF